MSEESRPAPRSYRDLALEHEYVEWLIRTTISQLVSDGAQPKEVLYSPRLPRMESELTQDSLRQRLEQLQSWEASLRAQLERFHWIEVPASKPPFLNESKPESQENEEPKEQRRRRRKKGAQDQSGPPGRGSE